MGISVAREGFDADAGWISFGRGGDGISSMIDAHVQSAFFNATTTLILAQYLRDEARPTSSDDSEDAFPITDVTVTFEAEAVVFAFEVRTGDWIDDQIPLIVGAGNLYGGEVKLSNMAMHWEKHIVFVDLTAQRCLIGGEPIAE